MCVCVNVVVKGRDWILVHKEVQRFTYADDPSQFPPRLYSEMDLLSSAAQQQAVVNAVSETQHVLSKEDFLKLVLPASSVEEGRRKGQ